MTKLGSGTSVGLSNVKALGSSIVAVGYDEMING